MTADDERHLRRAIALAGKARAAGDMPFGSLLVGPDGDVLAEDRNTVLTGRDISGHPELKLAVWAARELGPDVAAGTTMYTSCEPCPMCTGAIARSGLGRAARSPRVTCSDSVGSPADRVNGLVHARRL